MRLKKANAALALVSSLLALLHVGYSVYAYLTMYYSPTAKLLTAMPFIVVTCIHAVLGMSIVFLQGDGTRLDLYPKLNMRTVLQRISAALIFPLLIVHLKTFDLLKSASHGGQWVLFGAIMVCQVLFYATFATHVATSFSKALITLGWLGSRERQAAIDRVVYVLCAAVFVVAVVAVIRGQVLMFVPMGG